jgi:hypothetical protein
MFTFACLVSGKYPAGFLSEEGLFHIATAEQALYAMN